MKSRSRFGGLVDVDAGLQQQPRTSERECRTGPHHLTTSDTAAQRWPLWKPQRGGGSLYDVFVSVAGGEVQRGGEGGVALLLPLSFQQRHHHVTAQQQLRHLENRRPPSDKN